MPFHLAILECDTPIDLVRERYGTYGDIFTKLLNMGLFNLRDYLPNATLEISKWDVVDQQSYPNLSNIDGILLTGSKHDSFADIPWILRLVSYVQMAFRARKPVAGLCFGHQIIGRAMGSLLGRSERGWETSASYVHLTTEGSELFERKESLVIHQMHRDAVFSIPQGFVNLGSSSRCKIQGLYLPERVLTLQAHPEFDAFIMMGLLEKRHADGIFDDGAYADGMRRANLGHDGAVVARAILKFFFKG